MVCSVKIQNNGSVDIGINHTGGASSKGISPPSGKNDWGEEVTVSGCGDNHQVLLFEHDTDRGRGQNAMVFQDGTHWLHHLRGGVTAGEINKVPLDDNDYAVGFNNIHHLSDYGVKNGTHKMFHTNYETKSGVSVSQADLCPGGTVWPMGMHNEHGGNHDYGHRYACVYNKTEDKIEQARQGTSSANGTLGMYQDMVNRVCSKKVNLAFTVAPGVLCAQHAAGRTLAEGFCKEGTNFTSVPNVCSVAGLSAAGGQATYDGLLNWYCGNGNNITTAKCNAATDKTALSAKYCKTALGRADPWCSCYNVTNGVCDANPTAAGCAKKKQTFDKLVAATPSDQQNVWSGMEACFGRVCTGTGIFMPPNVNQNCDKSVNVCIQDIDIGSMTDSNITPVCDIKSGDGSPSVSEPSAAQDSAKSELDEAKAAVARGDDGAQERLDAAEAALGAADESAVKPISLTDFRTNPKSYIPKSLDGLKNDRKQQIGAAAMGALVLGCMMMLLLLVASAGGGGGGPAKRRFR